MANHRPVRRTARPVRTLPFGAPPRAWLSSEWAILPLRLFLGVTFLYAGLQKLANPNFFNASSGSSIQAQLIASARISPIHLLIGHLLQFAKPLGIIISLSEIAIGIGTLIGLWGRIAALGGAILSFSLFLTVSFHSSPYFTGADIVFFFAWMPLIISGSGTKLSLDARIARLAAKENGLPSPEVVPIVFSQVLTLCGQFNKGSCNAQQGKKCGPESCPVLLGPREPIATRVAIDSVDRRELVLGGIAAGVVGIGSAILAGAVAEGGRLVGGAKVAKGSSATLKAGGGNKSSSLGTLIGNIRSLPVGESATFTIPSSGDPGVVVRPTSTQLLGYDAVCPHAGCTVGYYKASNIFVCPCHGSEFQVATGDVISGPAPHGLSKVAINQATDGNLYVK